MNDPDLRRIWAQGKIPVLFRKGKQLLLKIPYGKNNRAFVAEGRRKQPPYNPQFRCWVLPRSAVEDISRRLLSTFGQFYLVLPYRAQETCAPACWDAVGLDCTCSCLGANHGRGQPGGRWYVLSHTCAVQWGDVQYRWSLIQSLAHAEEKPCR